MGKLVCVYFRQGADTLLGLKRIKPVLLLIVSTVFAIFLLEGSFRVYERYFLQDEITIHARTYFLQRLGYNEPKRLASSKEQNEYRMLSFGDSFAESPTLPQYAYSHILQDEFNAAAPDQQVAVYNLGRAGITFPNYIEQIEFWKQAVEFDAVLLNLYAGNDFTDFWTSNLLGASFDDLAKAARLRYGISTQIPHQFPFRFLDYSFAIWQSFRLRGGEALYRPSIIHLPASDYLAYQRHASHVYQSQRIPQWIEPAIWLKRLMKELQDLRQADKDVYVFLSHPHFLFSPDYYQQVLKRESLRPDDLDPYIPQTLTVRLLSQLDSDLEVYDLYPLLERHSREGQELYFGTNTHWNLEGNRVVGQYLAETIGRRWRKEGRLDDSSVSTHTDTIASRAAGSNEQSIRSLIQKSKPIDELSGQISALFASDSSWKQDEIRQRLIEQDFSYRPMDIEGEFEFIEGSSVGNFGMLNGWAFDRHTLEKPLLLAAFSRERLAGIGMTKLVREDVRSRFTLPTHFSPRYGYSFMIHEPAEAIKPDRLWLAAISLDKRFSFIAVERTVWEEIAFTSRDEQFAQEWYADHTGWVGDNQFQIARDYDNKTEGPYSYKIQSAVDDGNIRDLYLARYVDGLQPGKPYTISFDYRFDVDDSSPDISNHIQAAVRGGDHRGREAIADIEDYGEHRRPETVRINAATFDTGSFHTYTHTVTLSPHEQSLTLLLIIRFHSLQPNQNKLWIDGFRVH